MPDLLATATISVLERTSIFAMMFCRCVLTVWREMPSVAAISSGELPSTTSRSTDSSRLLRDDSGHSMAGLRAGDDRDEAARSSGARRPRSPRTSTSSATGRLMLTQPSACSVAASWELSRAVLGEQDDQSSLVYCPDLPHEPFRPVASRCTGAEHDVRRRT